MKQILLGYRCPLHLPDPPSRRKGASSHGWEGHPSSADATLAGGSHVAQDHTLFLQQLEPKDGRTGQEHDSLTLLLQLSVTRKATQLPPG